MASRELYMSTRSSGHQTGFQAAWRWKKPAVLWATIGHEFMSQRLVAVIILWSKSGHGAEEEQNNFQSFEDETIPLLLRWMGDGNFCAGFFHQDILDMIWHTKRNFRHDFLHSSEHHFVHRRSDGVSPTLFGLRQHHDITSWTSEGNFWSPQDVRLSTTRIGRHHQEKRQCCNEFIRIITKWGMIFLNKQPPDKTTPSIIRFVSCGRIFCVWQSLFICSLHPWWCFHNKLQRFKDKISSKLLIWEEVKNCGVLECKNVEVRYNIMDVHQHLHFICKNACSETYSTCIITHLLHCKLLSCSAGCGTHFCHQRDLHTTSKKATAAPGCVASRKFDGLRSTAGLRKQTLERFKHKKCHRPSVQETLPLRRHVFERHLA